MNITLLGAEYVGHVIDGRFRLVRWLGGGEQSSVFLTEVAGNPPQKAAIKFVAADDAHKTNWETARALLHPHLVRLFEIGRCELDGEQIDYAVTEYGEEVLSEVLAERPLTAAETGEMLPAVMDALGYLHAQGMVHGGLRPSNILAAGDRLKLSVDGVRKAGQPWQHNRLPNDYDAPEIATDKLAPAMDVWLLGVVLVKALTGETPEWNRASGGDPAIPASVPEPYAGIARECLRATPGRRCTLADVKARLAPEPAKAQAAERAPARAADPVPKPIIEAAVEPAAVPPPKPQSYGRIIIGAVVLLAIWVLLVALQHRTHTRPAAISQGSAASTASPAEEAPSSGDGSTTKGAVIHQVMPDVPQFAWETIHGHFKVEIRVEAGPDGNVSNAAIESQGPSRYFAEFALNAARNWKFKPAEQNGRAVASTWSLDFEFGRDGAVVTAVETRP